MDENPHTRSQPKKRLTKPFIIVGIGLFIVFGGLFGWGIVRAYFIKQFIANFAMPPPNVNTTIAKAEVWQPNLNGIGSVVAINGVQVSPEEPGMVVKIFFQSGQLVKQGDPLVQLDTDTDVQDLKNLEAQLRLAEITFTRQSKLYKTQSASAAALDEARASLDQLKAQTEKMRVFIRKKTVRAPFDGKIGIRSVNLGQYVNAGTPLVTLQSLDPLYVQFYLPEQDLQYLYLGQPVSLSTEAFGNKQFMGKINAINAEVSNTTRNILVQALFPNPQHQLYPGMFANVNVSLPQQQNIVTVPQTAIVFNLYGNTVFVIEKSTDKKGKPILVAKSRYVTTGDRRGNQVAVLKGLKPNEVVITSGQLKLQDGMQVIINNSVDINQNSSLQQDD